MSYVDGFVIVVPKRNMKDYRKMAASGGKIWKKHGALEYFECVGDDINPKMGDAKILSFPKMAKAKKDEKIIFSFIVYKSKKHRDEVNKKVMNDPSMHPADKEKIKMPFDMKRMAYGGFKAFVVK